MKFFLEIEITLRFFSHKNFLKFRATNPLAPTITIELFSDMTNNKITKNLIQETKDYIRKGPKIRAKEDDKTVLAIEIINIIEEKLNGLLKEEPWKSLRPELKTNNLVYAENQKTGQVESGWTMIDLKDENKIMVLKIRKRFGRWSRN